MQYTIYTNGSTDTYGCLYDANGQQLTFNDDYYGNLNCRIIYSLSAGQSYIVSIKHYDAQKTGAYNLIVSENSVIDVHGNTWDTATAISGTSVQGIVNYFDDLDYFTFTPSTDGIYTIYSTGIGDVNGHILDSNQNEIISADDSSDYNFYIKAYLKAGSLYYIFVEGMYEGSIGCTYNLHVNYTTLTDDFPNMGNIGVGTSLNGNIDYNGDIDSFNFGVSQSKNYTVSLSSNVTGNQFACTIYKYNAQGIRVDVAEGVENTNITCWLDTGLNYYIEIQEYYGINNTGSYNLSIT